MEGKREAYYYHSASKTGDSDKYNLHAIFQLQRALVLFLSVIICGNIFLSAGIGFAMICSFSYFHNGSYYCTRNNLNKDIYKLRWKDDSTTSHSAFEIQYGERLITCITGMAIFILTMIVAVCSNTLYII
jgi:hypothetical protein